MATRITLVSGTKTATGNAVLGQSYVNPGTRGRVQLDVTAASGTSPTLDVVVQDTLDGTNYNTVATFTQKTTTGRQVVDLPDTHSGDLRVLYTIGGTSPSFTFTVVLTPIYS